MNTGRPYRTDLINAAMGAHRLTNKAVAERAGVGVLTVSRIRNGNPRVGYMTLKRVVEALGLTISEIADTFEGEGDKELQVSFTLTVCCAGNTTHIFVIVV